jgi:hypothetical protein
VKERGGRGPFEAGVRGNRGLKEMDGVFKEKCFPFPEVEK